MANIIKSISIPMEIMARFLELHPNVNFSKWVRQQMLVAIEGHEQTVKSEINWDRFAKISGLTADELKELQREVQEGNDG